VQAGGVTVSKEVADKKHVGGTHSKKGHDSDRENNEAGRRIKHHKLRSNPCLTEEHSKAGEYWAGESLSQEPQLRVSCRNRTELGKGKRSKKEKERISVREYLGG